MLATKYPYSIWRCQIFNKCDRLIDKWMDRYLGVRFSKNSLCNQSAVNPPQKSNFISIAYLLTKNHTLLGP